MALLEVKNLSISFGGLRAVDAFEIQIEKGQLYGLIGPNGAGKTTVFNLLTGVYRPNEGIIRLDGTDITGKSPIEINHAGIARTFQNIRLFKDMTVIDNVKTAMNSQMKYSAFSGIFRLPSYRKEEDQVTARAMELLDVFGLSGQAGDLARNLPYGKQRELEIARALASSPKVLLLDEPAAGMNPTETQSLLEAVRLIRERFQVSVLLIEHDMSFVMGLCEHIIVLDYGRIIAEGSADEIRRNPKVIAAYLGGE